VTEEELNRARDRTWARLENAIAGAKFSAIIADIQKRAVRDIKEQYLVGMRRQKEIIEHALRTVPIYRQWPHSMSSKPVDISHFPVVTRTELSSNMGLFVSRDPIDGSMPRSDIFVTTTSGSTGHPVTHIKAHGDEGVSSSVVRQRIKQVYGLSNKYEQIDLGLHSIGKPLIEGHLLPGMTVSWNMRTFRPELPDFVSEYLAILGVSDPEVIFGTPSRLSEFAHLTTAYGFEKKPRIAISSFEPLLDSHIKQISDTFLCPVISLYGTSELGNFGVQCEAGAYHFSPDLYVVEILDAADQPTEPGKTGRIVVTNLSSRCMPLIRYDTGDLGVAASLDKCICGADSPRIESLSGRDLVKIITKRKEEYLPYRLFEYLGSKGFMDFQIQQYKPGELCIIYRSENSISEKFFEEFSELVDSFLQEKTVVNFDNRRDFILTDNGKRNPFVRI